MPQRSWSPCTAPGCPRTLERGGRCPDHARAQSLALEALRPTRTERGYSSRWARARRAILMASPLCVRCQAEGRIVAASEVDHRVPHKGDYARFWDPSNLQALCKSCHSRKTAIEDGRWNSALALPALRRPLTTALFVLCGPSTEILWVAAQSYRADLIIEVEHLIFTTQKTPLYECSALQRKLGLVERNRLLRRVCEEEPWSRVVLITPAPRVCDRRYWYSIAHSVQVVAPPLHACLAALDGDSHGGKLGRADAIRDWWARYVIDPNDTVTEVAAYG